MPPLKNKSRIPPAFHYLYHARKISVGNSLISKTPMQGMEAKLDMIYRCHGLVCMVAMTASPLWFIQINDLT